MGAGSAAALLFGIIGIVLIYSFYAPVFSEFIASAQQNAVNQYVGSQLQINPQAGQNVCNLVITFQPTLVAQSALGPGLTAGIGFAGGAWQLPNGASSINWTNCHIYGQIPIADLIPQPNITFQNLVPSDILLTGGGQVIHFNLVVIGNNGAQLSYTTNPFLTQSTNLPSGSLNVPKIYTFTYVISNIPKQSYMIQVTSDIPINGQSAGIPYVQQVS